MTRKNSFSEPTRQSPVSIILLIWKFYKQIIRQAWYILIPIFIGGDKVKENQMLYIFLVLILFAVISLVFAILAYYKFYFYIANGELHIQKGVIKKTTLNIPFDRIQTINFEQNIVHQVFDVVSLDIDTAGSKGNEFSFDAIDKKTASELRGLLLTSKNVHSENVNSDGVKIEDKGSLIMNLSITQLVKIGLSQNHFRSAMLFLVFVLWIYQQAEELGFKVEDQIEQVEWEGLTPSLIPILVLVALYFALIIIISIVRTVLKHFNLEFRRLHNGFKIISGLLNRRQFSALDRKIQMISWSDNPLKRLLKIFDLQLKQASSVEVVSKKSLRIPGNSMENINQVHHHLFPTIEFDSIQKTKIDFSFFWRRVLYTGLIPTALVSIPLFYFEQNTYAFLSGLILLYSVTASYVAYKKWSFSFHPEMIRTKKGIFGNYYQEIPLYKVQNVTVNQNLFQQRKSLANLVLHSASGSMRIPYIPLVLAKKLRDYVLYKVESDFRHWM